MAPPPPPPPPPPVNLASTQQSRPAKGIRGRPRTLVHFERLSAGFGRLLQRAQDRSGQASLDTSRCRIGTTRDERFCVCGEPTPASPSTDSELCRLCTPPSEPFSGRLFMLMYRSTGEGALALSTVHYRRRPSPRDARGGLLVAPQRIDVLVHRGEASPNRAHRHMGRAQLIPLQRPSDPVLGVLAGDGDRAFYAHI